MLVHSVIIIIAITNVNREVGFVFPYIHFSTWFPPDMYKEAETVTREAMGLMPDKPRFYFSLGVLLGKTQRLEVRIRRDKEGG